MHDGTTLAQYRIVGKLGEGGMGRVYRAEDTRLAREVAIKVLPADLADDPDRLARLEREAQLLARLDHPNIAAVYGIEEAVPRPPDKAGEAAEATAEPVRFLVMQLAEGESLDDLLDRRGGAPSTTTTRTDAVTAVPSPRASQPDAAPLRYRGLPLDEALPIAAAIADALEAAHEQGIIHRDLKPANVKVALDRDVPRIKVLDFGLAKIYQGGADDADNDPSASPTMVAATQAGLIMGTAGYMSPEQARGQRVDQRADIWAFGVLLYEMLTGRRLFRGETVSDTLAAVLKDDVDLRALPDDTPLPLRRLLRRCLQRDPRRRLHHIADAQLEIEEAGDGRLGDDAGDIAALTGGAATADGETREAPARGLTWRHAVAALLLLAAGAAVAALVAPGPTPGEAPVRVYGDLGPSDARGAVISPDGTKIALVIDDQLFVRDFDGLEARLVEGSEEHRGRPFWSPDSERLAFFGRDGLHVASAEGGSSRRLDYDLRWAARSATWVAAGIIVAVADRRTGELVLLDPDGNDERVVARSAAPGSLRHPVLLPDERTLVYELAERSDGVFVYGTVVAQHGLTPESPIEVIVERDDVFVGFRYVEPLELLLAESPHTGIWSIPLSRDGTDVGIPEHLLPDGEELSMSRDGTLLYRALESRLGTEPFRWIDRNGEAGEAIPSGKRDPRSLALSPDGTRVAFTAPRAPGQPSDVWVLDLVSGAETRITAEPGTGDMPAWRSNDTLVFSDGSRRRGDTALLSQAASGAGSPQVIVNGGVFRNPAASADGRFVTFEALTVDGALRQSRQGRGRGAANGTTPAPGGGTGATPTSVAGQAGETGSAPPDENTAEASTGARTEQAGDADSAPQLAWNIYYVDETNGGPIPYRVTDDNETKSSPSPDGTRIAYISDASGSNEVWVDTFPQPTQPIRISVSGGGNVRWSGDGEEIIFDDGADTLWSASVDPAVPHGRSAYGDPARLFAEGDVATRFSTFNTRSWDAGRDRTAILTVQRYAEGTSHLNVIENFPRWYRERR